MSTGYRPTVVLAIGVILGAGLAALCSFATTTPAPPAIVLVLKSAPVPAPMPLIEYGPRPIQQAVAAVAAPVIGAGPVRKTPAARPVRAGRTPLPEGVMAGLRRSSAGSTGAVGRELAAGARALERGTAYTAWSHFTRALKLDPDNHDALMGVALCHYELSQKGAADRALSRLLEIDPTHPEASILRGFIAQLARDESAAVEWYERALPRLEDGGVADELRSVIATLRSQSSPAPTATASAERTR